MKTIQFIIFSALILLMACIKANAQQYTIQHPVQIDSSGVMKTQDGTVFAIITNDSIIKDHNGGAIAFIDYNGNLIDRNGNVLGKIAENGDFQNTKNEIEYTVKAYRNSNTFYVYDSTGRNVLTVTSKYKTQAGSLAYVHKNMLVSR